MFLIQLFGAVTLLAICVKGNNSNETCDNEDVMLRNILSINLTIADQKTEICSLKERVERLERLHGLAPSTELQQMHLALNQYDQIIKQLFDRRLTSETVERVRKMNESFHKAQDAKKICTDDWVNFQEQCYFFSKDKLSWYDANTSCVAMDSRLAIVDDEKINTFIRNDKSRFVRFWTGGKKQGNTWRWAGTGSALDYTAWCPQQPDGNGMLCVSFLKLVPPTCYWTDRKCKFRQAYICQRPIDTPTERVGPGC